MLTQLKRENRNNAFNSIVLDRRGRCVPTLLCRSCDVIVTCNTGTGETDFLPYIEVEHGYNGERLFREWPQIDEGGEYKELIDGIKIQLKKVMAQVRDLV